MAKFSIVELTNIAPPLQPALHPVNSTLPTLNVPVIFEPALRAIAPPSASVPVGAPQQRMSTF